MPSRGARFRLRDLPAEVRLVLAAFLVLAAAGYASALVQVHYQSAGAAAGLGLAVHVVAGLCELLRPRLAGGAGTDRRRTGGPEDRRQAGG